MDDAMIRKLLGAVGEQVRVVCGRQKPYFSTEDSRMQLRDATFPWVRLLTSTGGALRPTLAANWHFRRSTRTAFSCRQSSG